MPSGDNPASKGASLKKEVTYSASSKGPASPLQSFVPSSSSAGVRYTSLNGDDDQVDALRSWRSILTLLFALLIFSIIPFVLYYGYKSAYPDHEGNRPDDVILPTGMMMSKSLHNQPRGTVSGDSSTKKMCVCTVKRVNKSTGKTQSTVLKVPIEEKNSRDAESINSINEKLATQCEHICARERPHMIQSLTKEADDKGKTGTKRVKSPSPVHFDISEIDHFIEHAAEVLIPSLDLIMQSLLNETFPLVPTPVLMPKARNTSSFNMPVFPPFLDEKTAEEEEEKLLHNMMAMMMPSEPIISEILGPLLMMPKKDGPAITPSPTSPPYYSSNDGDAEDKRHQESQFVTFSPFNDLLRDDHHPAVPSTQPGPIMMF